MRFADHQVAAIIRGARTLRVIDFPGRDGVSVAVRLLADSEVDDCRLRAFGALQKAAAAQGWDVAAITDVDPDLVARMQTREIVAKAFYDPDTIEAERPVPFFSSVAELARECDAPTVERLFQAYLEHQQFVSPLRTMSEEEVKELVAALGKEPAARVTLAGLDASTLSRLCISLASALRRT